MLALLIDGTTVALAAEDRPDPGDALTVDATQTRVAIACRRAPRGRLAQVETTVFVLALLSERTTIAIAAEHGCETGNTLSVETAQSGLTIAGGTAFALRRALTVAAVVTLARLARRAVIAPAAEDFRCLGNASAFAAGQSRLAIARRAALPFLLAQIPSPVPMLALLTGRTGFFVTAIDRRKSSETLSFEASEPRLAIASGATFRAWRGNTNLRGAIPASRTARNARALVSGRALAAAGTAARRDRWRANQPRPRSRRHLRYDCRGEEDPAEQGENARRDKEASIAVELLRVHAFQYARARQLVQFIQHSDPP